MVEMVTQTPQKQNDGVLCERFLKLLHPPMERCVYVTSLCIRTDLQDMPVTNRKEWNDTLGLLSPGKQWTWVLFAALEALSPLREVRAPGRQL